MRLSGTISEKGFHAFKDVNRIHAGHIIPRVWIITADHEKARFWQKTEHGIHEIGQAEHHSSHHAHPYGRREHHDETAFVEKLSEWLQNALDENAFDRIILAAAPRMIGAFHEILPANLQVCITATIPKDFMHFGQKDIEQALEKIIVI